jgi:hypothetical protein
MKKMDCTGEFLQAYTTMLYAMYILTGEYGWFYTDDGRTAHEAFAERIGMV